MTSTTAQLPSLQLLADEIAEPIAYLLFRSPPTIEKYGAALPLWMASAAATDRMNVWIAVGGRVPAAV